MLVYFKVGNYKSIKDPVIINFAASAIGELSESNVLEKGKDNLLKSVLLYGPNAGGKSSLLEAFVFYKWLIISSATEKGSTDKIETEPFRLNKNALKLPGLFEAEFYIGKTKYRYGFEADSNAIRKEWLLEVRATTSQALFLRIEQQFEVESRFKDAEGLQKRTRKNALFLSVAAQWNVKQAEDIISWFADIYTVHGMGDHTFRKTTAEFLGDKSYEQIINRLMREADFGIEGLDTMELTSEVRKEILEKLPTEMREDVSKRMDDDAHAIFTFHAEYDSHGKQTGTVTFSLDQDESEGTRKFFNLAGPFADAVLKGKLIIIDEFDARLHSLLTKALIRLFNSTAITSGAQLLAACHDTALLDRELLRRDQIYFVEKDKYGASHLDTLAGYKARKEEPYYKNYLDGKYGGIPFIPNLESSFPNGQKQEPRKI